MCTIRCLVLVPAILANTSAITKFRHAQLYPRLHPPFHSNVNASAATHSSPNLRIQTCATAPLPSLPFPIQLQHLTSVADCFHKPCVNASRYAMLLCPPFFLVTSLLKYVTKGYPGSECRTGGWVVGSAVRPQFFFF